MRLCGNCYGYSGLFLGDRDCCGRVKDAVERGGQTRRVLG